MSKKNAALIGVVDGANALKAQLIAVEALLAAETAAHAETSAKLSETLLALAHDYVPMAEYRRVQAVLRTTQQFHAKVKRQVAELQPTSDWKTRAAAARAAAMESGACVKV